MKSIFRVRLFSKLSFFLISVVFVSNVCSQGTWTQQKGLILEPDPRAYATGFTIEYSSFLITGSDSKSYSNECWELIPPFDAWSQKANFPGERRTQAVGFTIDKKGYVGMGLGENGALKDLWEYDPALNSWTRKADLPGASRSAATAFTIGMKAYVGTGFSGGFLNDFYEYDPLTNSWASIAPIPVARAGAVGFALNGKGYVGTGDGSSLLKDFWQYEVASNSWSGIADFGGAARHHAVAYADVNAGYVGTGFLNSGLSSTVSKDIWQYHPLSNSWTQMPDYGGEARAGAVHLGRGKIGTGIGSRKFSDFWTYNTYANKWEKYFEVAGSRSAAVGLSIDNTGYIFMGGFWFEPKKEVWAFDPLNNAWSQKADFEGEPRSYSCGFTIGSKAYVGLGTGGVYGQIYLKDFWEYNAATNKWTKKADYPGLARNSAIAFALQGKGYIGLGSGDPYIPTPVHLPRELWQYDPVTDKWNKKADPPFEGRYGAAAFTINDKSYITGGSSSGARKDLWEYDGANDKWTQKADFPGAPRLFATAFSIGLDAYVGTGQVDYITLEDFLKKDVWRYNQRTEKWVQVADFAGGARVGASSFVIGKNAYLGFGRSFGTGFGPDEFRRDLWKYTPSNQPPVAAGFPMLYYYPNAHLLNAWGSYDPEGGAVKFLWRKTGGPSQYKMLYENASTPVISDLITGTYTFQLTVTDPEGATATADVTFSVKVNQPPVANGFVMMYYYPDAHLLNAWGSYDPEGQPVKFWWTKIAGPVQYQMLYPEASTPVISKLVAGTYRFQLRVTDIEGAIAYDTVDMVNSTPLSMNNDNGRMLPESEQRLLLTNKLIISPNPVIDQLNVRWNSDYLGVVKLTVMDMSGRAVKVMDLKKERKEQLTILELDGVNPGSYYLFIHMKNGRSLSSKFVKH